MIINAHSVVTMKDTQIVIFDATQDEAEFVDSGLVAFNASKVLFSQEEVVYKNHVIKDDGKVVAGLNAFLYSWKILHIDILFVDEKYRGKGLGTRLLNHVENEARTMGSTLSHLDTFDFQAKDFYLKHGYEIFGILEDCPPGHKRYYLKKYIKSSRALLLNKTYGC
jgi:GNAT superfamily N-acetyltransferase